MPLRPRLNTLINPFPKQQIDDDSKIDIMREVIALLSQTQALCGHLDKAIALQPHVQAASSAANAASSSSASRLSAAPQATPKILTTASSTSATSSRTRSLENQLLHDNVPLSREEIAKLLLITAKAWKLELLTNKQRDFIKMVIVKQEGYLRVILSFEGTQQIFQALRAVGGADEEDDDAEDETYDNDFEEGDDNEDEEDDDDDDDDYDYDESRDEAGRSLWEKDN